MTLTRYLYSGPPSCASLRVGNARESMEVLMHPGKPVELPADHGYTLVLLALNHLQPLPSDTPATGKTRVTQPPTKDQRP